MRIDVDGQKFDVPDDATTDEIDKISRRPRAKPVNVQHRPNDFTTPPTPEEMMDPWATPPTAQERGRPFDPDAYLREKRAAGIKSEAEMMQDLATADAAGDTELAQHIAGRIKAQRAEPFDLDAYLREKQAASRPAEPPGLVRRALTWAATPFKAMEPTIENNRRMANQSSPPLGLTKDSGNVMSGLNTFASGLPGYQPYAQSDEARTRMARFASEHPKTALALGLAAGPANPMIPTQRLLPQALAAAAERAAVPMAAAAAPEMAEAVGASSPQAVNAYETAARASKVSEMVKAIDANAASHLGVNPQDPRFAEALGTLPEQWWDGMGQVAKINKPSQQTIDQVVDFYRSRAAQGAAASAPPAAQIAPPAAEAAQQAPAAAQALGPAPATLSSQLRGGADFLSNLPPTKLSLIDLLVGAHGLPHLGPTKALALTAASKLARQYVPPMAGGAMRGAAALLDEVPASVVQGSAAELRALLRAGGSGQ